MKLTQWLRTNGEVVKTTASVLQTVVVIGGIFAAVHAFILSGQTEERERVRNTIPYLEKASLPEFQEARARFDEMQYVFMSADMAGPRDYRNADYRNVQDLAALERKTGQILTRLASFYETVNQCVSASICSERATRHTLCRDATQLYDDLNHLKRVLENRYASEKFQMLTPHAQDRKRMYASLRGLEVFAIECRAWNERHPRDKVLVSDGPRRAPL
jgi:hypothetical protein